MTTAEAHEIYCLKCKTKRTISDVDLTVLKNGSHAMKGKCPECGGGVSKLVKSPISTV